MRVRARICGAPGPVQALDGEIVSLGPAGSEDDFRRMRPGCRGQRLAGVLDGPPGPAAGSVQRGGVAGPGEFARQGGQRLRGEGGGGGMIEVDRHRPILPAPALWAAAGKERAGTRRWCRFDLHPAVVWGPGLRRVTSAMNASLITAANPALIVVTAIVLLAKTTRLGWLGHHHCGVGDAAHPRPGGRWPDGDRRRPADRRQGPAQARGAGHLLGSARAGPVAPTQGCPGQVSRRQDPGTALSGPRTPLLPERCDVERFHPPRVDPQSGRSPAEEGPVHGANHVRVAGGEAVEGAVQQQQAPAPVVGRAVALPRQEVRKGGRRVSAAGGSGGRRPRQRSAWARPVPRAASSAADRPLARAARSRHRGASRRPW